MKNTLFICLFAMFALSGCVDDEEEFATGGNISPELTPENKENAVLNTAVFDQLNLDYPGLEKVKQYHEAGEDYLAASALLEYYRMRANAENPALSLVNITLNKGNASNNFNDGDQNIADFALEYRFFVKGFYEGSDKKPYSLGKAGSIDWNKNASVGEEYLKQLHRHQWFIPQAKVYRVSGDEKYIKSWIEVYSDWITQNPQPAEGPNTTSWWQLQVATRLIDQVQLLEYFKHSDNFTPEWLTTFLTSFAEQADFLVKYPYAESGNILVTQGQALIAAGVLMPELKNAQNWLDKGCSIANAEVKNQFMADGWHKEMSLHYHISAVADFYETIRLIQANKLTSKLDPEFNEYLRSAAEVLIHFTYPNYFEKGSDYIVPGFNDSWKSNWSRSTISKNFIKYTELFPDSEEFKYMATAVNGGNAQGKTPGNDIKVFGDAGYYVMRNGWEPSSTVMIFSNNKSNDISTDLERWSHNQPDNGTFELYHNGRNFFPDSGVSSYAGSGTPNNIRSWFRQTKSHNTMILSDKETEDNDEPNAKRYGDEDIKNTLGKLIRKGETNQYQFVATENQGYANFTHRRSIFFVTPKEKPFFVIVDEGIGNATGFSKLYFHLCDDKTAESVSLDIENHGAHTTFSDNNNLFIRSFGNADITQNEVKGYISYDTKGLFLPRKAYSLVMDKKENSPVRYITVIYPVANETPEISAKFTDDETFIEDAIKLEVTVNGQRYELGYTK